MFLLRKPSSRSGVYLALGPSSKVRATRGASTFVTDVLPAVWLREFSVVV